MEETLKTYKSKYYHDHSKAIFNKRKQKKEIADIVLENVGFDNLLKNSVYIVGENNVYINYGIFKYFANDDNYADIITYFMNIIRYLYDADKPIHLHINLNGLTISGFERHRSVIDIFLRIGGSEWIPLMKKYYLYHTPHIIDTLRNVMVGMFPVLMDADIEYISKKESDARLELFLGSKQNTIEEKDGENI